MSRYLGLFFLLFCVIFGFVALGSVGGGRDQSSESSSVTKEQYSPPKPTAFSYVPISTFNNKSFSRYMDDYFNTERTYIITYSARIEYNDSVGNQWGHSVTYNDESIDNGSELTVKGGMNIPVKITVTEFDSYSDQGTASIWLKSCDVGVKKTEEVEVIVRENRGRYAGNTAKWIFEITIERIA